MDTNQTRSRSNLHPLPIAGPMDSVLRISPDVQSVIDDDGAVLLDMKGGKYFSLNGLGADIWTRIEAGTALPEIEREIAEEYGVPQARIRDDVATFVQNLTGLRLIDAGV